MRLFASHSTLSVPTNEENSATKFRFIKTMNEIIVCALREIKRPCPSRSACPSLWCYNTKVVICRKRGVQHFGYWDRWRQRTARAGRRGSDECGIKFWLFEPSGLHLVSVYFTLEWPYDHEWNITVLNFLSWTHSYHWEYSASSRLLSLLRSYCSCYGWECEKIIDHPAISSLFSGNLGRPP